MKGCISLKVLSGQETIHSRIGKKKQVNTAIDEIGEKLDEVSKKLDADEVDLSALQVNFRPITIMTLLVRRALPCPRTELLKMRFIKYSCWVHFQAFIHFEECGTKPDLNLSKAYQ